MAQSRWFNFYAVHVDGVPIGVEIAGYSKHEALEDKGNSGLVHQWGLHSPDTPVPARSRLRLEKVDSWRMD